MFLRPDEQGRILATVSTSQKFASAYPDYVWVDAEAVSWSEHYLSGEQVVPRPDPESIPTPSTSQIVADGVSELQITGIPIGATLQIIGPIEDEWIEESGSAEISVDVPGLYSVKIEKWPQKSIEVVFNAT
jgi:hypothetical protein